MPFAEPPEALPAGACLLAFDTSTEHLALALQGRDGAGFTRLAPAVFAGMSWGTDMVLARQRERFAALGLRWHELPERADIDRPQDLWRLGDAAQALAIGRTSP